MGVRVNINNKIYVLSFVFHTGCEGDDYCKKKKNSLSALNAGYVIF